MMLIQPRKNTILKRKDSGDLRLKLMLVMTKKQRLTPRRHFKTIKIQSKVLLTLSKLPKLREIPYREPSSKMKLIENKLDLTRSSRMVIKNSSSWKASS